jgi:hypothetical protein
MLNAIQRFGGHYTCHLQGGLFLKLYMRQQQANASRKRLNLTFFSDIQGAWNAAVGGSGCDDVVKDLAASEVFIVGSQQTDLQTMRSGLR